MKLIASYIVEGDDEVFKLSVDSIKDYVDEIIVIDGNKYNNPMRYKINDKITVIHSPYEHENKGANGKQRNKYLDYLKQYFIGCWNLTIDADEIASEGIKSVKEFIHYTSGEHSVFNVHMRHLIYDIDKEDATQLAHFAPARLFKVTKDLYYDEVEHPVLQGITHMPEPCSTVCLWHLAYAKHLFDVRKKYLNHKTKSNVHTPGFLKEWFTMHMTGTYPTAAFDTAELPNILREYFIVEEIEDVKYFHDRTHLEAKHFIDAHTWKAYFNPETMIEVGCGVGQRVFAALTYGIDACGFDKSYYAVFKAIIKDNVMLGDVTTIDIAKDYNTKFDLVVAYDILEHISYDDINKVLYNIYNLGKKNYLFSIPFKGDPNLEKDKTHIIKETRSWWETVLITHGFKIEVVPRNFLYADQLIIASKGEQK